MEDVRLSFLECREVWGNTVVFDSDVGLIYFLGSTMTRRMGIGEGSHVRRRINPGVICQLSLHFPSDCAHQDLASTCLKCDECTVKGSHWFSAMEV